MKKILIIEDDARLAAALTIRLKAAGYEVMTAPDGFRGFMAAVNGKPDLILMDIGLPYGDGLSVAENLQDADLQEVPTIFMTASSRKNLSERAKEKGAAGFFHKPFDTGKLLEAIERALSRPPRPAPAAVTERALTQAPVRKWP